MKRSVLLSILAALLLAACDTPANTDAPENPLVGTWTRENLDPNYPATAAVVTIVFTETEFSYSYKWISGRETSYKGSYIYTDNLIFLTITEINGDSDDRYTHEIYHIYNNELYISTGLFYSGTYQQQ
jgi:hypothetical protein